MLLPTLFSIYVQELLDLLKDLRVGCYFGETFLGAIAWADNFLLAAPTRGAMHIIFDTATMFVKKHGVGVQHA